MGPEVLLSAMFLENEDYIDTLGIHSDCVVINQCDRVDERRIHREKDGKKSDVLYVETKERGLSASRNMAIEKARGDICILCDNDVEYVPDYDLIINDAFEKYDADVIVFFIKRPERQHSVFSKPAKMGYLSVLKIFSPEIAFRKKSIGDIRFNEMFGAGARYIMGEENLFLYECLKRKKKVIYVPRMIACVREEESTWFKGYDSRFFISRGANYAAMTRMLSWALILQFAVRKRKLYASEMKTTDAIRLMFKGRKEYLDICRGRS